MQWSLHLTTYNLHANTPEHKIKMPEKLGLETQQHTGHGAIWLVVIFALELRAIHKNLKLRNFDAHIHGEQIVFQSGTNSNYLVVLIQTEACQ